VIQGYILDYNNTGVIYEFISTSSSSSSSSSRLSAEGTGADVAAPAVAASVDGNATSLDTVSARNDQRVNTHHFI